MAAVSNERARRVVAAADTRQTAMGELDELADRLWNALVPEHPSSTLFRPDTAPEALEKWRRVAAEAARWAIEQDEPTDIQNDKATQD